MTTGNDLIEKSIKQFIYVAHEELDAIERVLTGMHLDVTNARKLHGYSKEFAEMLCDEMSLVRTFRECVNDLGLRIKTTVAKIEKVENFLYTGIVNYSKHNKAQKENDNG